MGKLSARQQSILVFIRWFLDESNYPPTIRDIQRGCKISSTSVVDYNLDILQKHGYIRRSPEISRGLELTDDLSTSAEQTNVPIIGHIAAGIPLPTEDSWRDIDPLDTLELPPGFGANTGDMYALRVKGTSMIDALIDDGDLVVLRPVSDVRNGDTVVAWLKMENEATLKRLYREGPLVRLQPCNSQMNPIYTNADNVEIQGKVVAILRVTE